MQIIDCVASHTILHNGILLTLSKCYSPGTDPEEVIRDAFACFDEHGTGKINKDHLREMLFTMGDCLKDSEVDKY